MGSRHVLGGDERYDGITPLSTEPSAPQITYPARETAPDDQTLRELGDQVRISIREDNELGPKGPELMRILGAIVKSECGGVPMLRIQSIIASHLDKVLDDMLNKDYHPESMSDQHRADLTIATSLQRQWRLRFGEAYSGIDIERAVQMTDKGGLLEGLAFDYSADPMSSKLWVPDARGKWKAREPVEICEGRWWPTVACPDRDGVLFGSATAILKEEKNMPVLLLLNGTEKAYHPSATVKYVREGGMADMCVPLISKVGCRVRTFRGHRLQSPFSPEAGVRYDGQYVLKQYNQIRVPETELFKMTLVLQRVQGQVPMHELSRIPRPSDMDDWQVFEKHEGKMIKDFCPTSAEVEWKLAREKLKVDKSLFQNKIQLEYEASMKGWLDNSPNKLARKFKSLRWDH